MSCHEGNRVLGLAVISTSADSLALKKMPPLSALRCGLAQRPLSPKPLLLLLHPTMQADHTHAKTWKCCQVPPPCFDVHWGAFPAI